MGGTLGLEQRHPSSGGTLLYRSTRLAAIAHCVTTGVCHGAEGPARLAGEGAACSGQYTARGI